MTDKKTIIVGGNFRGGTTAMAGLLQAAGIFIGDELGQINKEDLAFQKLFHYPGDGLNIQDLNWLIKDRNSRFDVWGFKYPGIHLTVSNWSYLLRNPYFIFVLRDPLAVALSEMNRSKVTGQLNYHLHRTTAFNSNMIGLYEQQPNRVHLVSFERLLTRTERTIREIFAFLGMEVDVKKLAQTIKLGASEYETGMNFVNP